ncbi:glycosyltransferase [uncultured Bacteroides sp.]|uniref:CgeB family protein n=1 Tax=uncultured Bacteroides sp. TaxID=162156 RepID=UPI0025FFF45C|nr:glycosyltransferase [uncultured Bacteroides sp.]
MRIAIIGSPAFDSLEYNLNESFNHIGHECQIFDIYSSWRYNQPKLKSITRTLNVLGRRYSENYDEKVFMCLTKNVLDFKPDLVIGVYRFIHPLLVKKIKKEGIRIIHINPDALTTFELQQLFVESYDVYFTKDPYMFRFMKDNMKLNVKLYCEAFNTRIHIKPAIRKEEAEQICNIDVLAFGNLYPYRNRMLACLKERGISLSLYGTKSRYFLSELTDCFRNKYIAGREKSEILYGAKIVFNNLHFAEIESVNNKFFEVNGSGAFQLCDYRPILKELLPVDPELVSFKNIDEAAEKIKYYLNHSEERFEISERIYQHFLGKYNYDQLTSYVLSSL